MQKPEVEVVVRIEVEEVDPYSSILIHWQRAIVGYVVRRSIRESVFDNPESVTEIQGENQTDL